MEKVLVDNRTFCVYSQKVYIAYLSILIFVVKQKMQVVSRGNCACTVFYFL